MATPPRRRYFDNAATSFPKPPAVVEAMSRFALENGASPRGRYLEAREAGRLVHRCRERIRTLINGESAEHVVFTLNTSDALNIAIKGVVGRRLGRGEPAHVVTTAMDHNSVLRPLNALAAHGVTHTLVAADPRTGLIDPADIQQALRPETVLVALNHAGNVTGTIQDAGAVGRLCRGRGVLFLLDAAQSLGHIPVDARLLGADLLAFPGHKGLLGPTGTGGLYIRPGVEERMVTLREGGTGTLSEHDTQPGFMPDRFEPGSHNTVGIVGLSEGVQYLLGRGADEVRRHELTLSALLMDGVRGLPGLRLLGPDDPEGRVGVFSFVHETIDAAEFATILETHYGILSRAGLHCAPHAHAALGTAPPGGCGAVRLSLGPFLTGEDVEFAAAALREVCAEGVPAHSA